MHVNSSTKQFDPKTTAKGTELPLMNLKGKPYLQVAHRLVWFREEHPDWTITTELNYDIEKGFCVAKATIGSLSGNGTITPISTAHKTETRDNFSDFIEKAETGAVGRALAMVGYGTQYEPEFDEGDRIVDSPMPVAVTTTKKAAVKAAPLPTTVDTISLIRTTAEALDSKGILALADISAHIKDKYEVEKTAQLNPAQQDDLLKFLTAMLKTGRMN